MKPKKNNEWIYIVWVFVVIGTIFLIMDWDIVSDQERQLELNKYKMDRMMNDDKQFNNDWGWGRK